MAFLAVLLGLMTLMSLLIAVILLFNMAKVKDRLIELEGKLNNLALVSDCFPDFIAKGETITRNISEELTMKQQVLQKMIQEAEKTSQKLGNLEEKVQQHTLEKDTIADILILVNHGFSPEEIAPKLNLPIGEVELVVKLKKYLHSPLKEKL